MHHPADRIAHTTAFVTPVGYLAELIFSMEENDIEALIKMKTTRRSLLSVYLYFTSNAHYAQYTVSDIWTSYIYK